MVEKFEIKGMTCASCQAHIDSAVSKLGGVNSVNVNLITNSMVVDYNENQTDSKKIIKAVQDVGYDAKLSKASTKGTKNSVQNDFEKLREGQMQELKEMRVRLISSFVFLIPLLYIAMATMLGLPTLPIFVGQENALVFALAQALLATPVLILNRKFFISGFKALFKRAANMDTLVAIGSGASYIYGIVIIFCLGYAVGHGNLNMVHDYIHSLYFESSATILTLVTLGKYFETKSKIKTTSSLSKLIDLSPKTARILKGGKEIEVQVSDLRVGDIVVVRAGETISVDGMVEKGEAGLNQSAITGESMPVTKAKGAKVISASVVMNGTLQIRAEKVGEDTTLMSVIRLVSEAGGSKAPISRIADKVSGIFALVVMGIAVFTLLLWNALGYGFGFALSNAVAVLVISCPCALGLATPVAIMVSMGKSAELGVLIRTAEALERLSKIDTVMLDKTGTITSGEINVTGVVMFGKHSEDEVKTISALIERNSKHPLAIAISNFAGKIEDTKLVVKNYKDVIGKGATADIGRKKYYIGNLSFVKSNCELSEKEFEKISSEFRKFQLRGQTSVALFTKNEVLGIFALADTVRQDSKLAIEKLKSLGLKVVMLTGDNKVTAQAVKKELDIDECISDVLPADKQQVVEDYQKKGASVAMVGDGINDSPALGEASVGVALRSGTDIANLTADVVLMNNSLMGLITAIELSHATMRNIKQNLFWAFFYNALGIPLAAGMLYVIAGIGLSPMIASLAMSLSSVCVVCNALRLKLFKSKHDVPNGADEQSGQSPEQTNQIQETNTKTDIKKEGGKTMQYVLNVEGMMCANCAGHVKKALEEVSGVTSAEVDLQSKKAVVTTSKKVSEKALEDAVTKAGYSVKK